MKSRLNAAPAEAEAIRAVAASSVLSSQAPAEMPGEAPAARPVRANPIGPIDPAVPEGEAAVGVSDEEASIAGVSAKLELNYIVGAFARANLPINEQFRLYGRVGAVNAEVEGSATGGGFNFAESSSDSGVGYGAGAELMVSSQFGVRGDYTRYDIEDIEADAFTVAAVFKF